MAKRIVVRLTANFERNLAEIERFLAEAEAPAAFDALLDDLLTTVIPNLERFPDMGRPFLAIPARSVETTEALDRLRAQMHALTADADTLREYLLRDYLLLYLRLGDRIHLLSIRHHRQLSFDLEGLWVERH
ncbi:MAG: type II toxin-antitoxin system RelE/ParE family toxin [Chromatiales bacterium]|jgi:plasmid stabilization system protein ParE|nr:type II toxin-antitoxin system RelE/ParE family toxin [Chromatiales bacterium]MDX9765946.1 type II toxin-antitoxin system RelE/ParE family toxin [Ectothiorhodospiraceae bacterium]